MKTFSELEKAFHHSTVHTGGPGNHERSGFLALARRQTEVALSSVQPFDIRTNEKGWFDLEVKMGSGDALLMVDAISQGTRAHFRDEKTSYVETIFPNILVFGAQKLGSDRLVHSISFVLPGFNRFFHYTLIDRLGIGRGDPQVVNAVRNALELENGPGDVFEPLDLYVVHGYSSNLLTFSVGSRRYSVWPSVATTASPNAIDVRIEPIARIDFDQDTPVGTALDHVWEWKRLFEQLAFCPLAPNAISVRSRGMSPYCEADIYLPMLDACELDTHPGDIPLNMWADRSCLEAAMQVWLSKTDDRRVFRVAISRVLDRRRTRITVDDIVALCAAVESLVELDEPSKLTGDDLDALADAANDTAQARGLDVGRDRIRGVLDLLKHQSLPRRLRLLGRTLGSDLSIDAMKLLADVTRTLRTVAAHGQSMPEITLPSVQPTIDALLGVCVLYDLTTCGVPASTAAQNPILALQEAMHGIDVLRSQKEAKRNRSQGDARF